MAFHGFVQRLGAGGVKCHGILWRVSGGEMLIFRMEMMKIVGSGTSCMSYEFYMIFYDIMELHLLLVDYAKSPTTGQLQSSFFQSILKTVQ